jgi:hypothetical protein
MKLAKRLCGWRKTLYIPKIQHHIAAKYWQRCHYALGLIATIAGVLATSAAIDTRKAGTEDVRWIAPTVVTVLAAVIAFLRPDGKADMHHDKGVRYNDLRRRIRMSLKLSLGGGSVMRRICPYALPNHPSPRNNATTALVRSDSLAERNGFEPPVPVIRAKVAAPCQFRFSVRTECRA